MTNRSLVLFPLIGLLTNLPSASADEAKTITVYKTPWCGCCEAWSDAMKAAGFHVVTENMEDLTAIKKQAGVPEDLQACHTAVVGGDRKYVVEGHVPLEAISKMMTERPDIRGLAVPGMPQGSLGMGYDPSAVYTVFAIGMSPGETPEPYLTTGD
ncbi:MAG: DUF411 domain-containing protein [Roseibium sp.]|uniref:DUF411 domain-containing protein n=1 Tax=Roseibium sp. TaxID=1936156 RepID=UPI00260AEC09|nr:DUF411 domain-containing protein [Roseibium sp.]MCV0425219.1 DUF411 domain-containing protein [Roseibium sp.]